MLDYILKVAIYNFYNFYMSIIEDITVQTWGHIILNLELQSFSSHLPGSRY